MAIGVTNRSSGGDTSNASTYATNSFTPSANSLLIACFAASQSSVNPTIPSVSDTSGLTWVQVSDNAYLASGISRARITIFAAHVGGSPVAITVTGDYGTPQIGCRLSVFEVTGSDVANSGVAASVVQNVLSTAGATGTSLSLTLAAAGDANNRSFLFLDHAASETIGHEAGWTQIGAASHLVPAFSASSQCNLTSFDTSVTASWASSVAYGAIALEIKALVAGSFNLIVDTVNFPVNANPVTLNVGLPCASANYPFNASGVTLKTGVVVARASFPFNPNPVGLIWNVDCPKGAFYFPSGGTLNNAIMGRSNTDGVVLGCYWHEIEPSRDTYVFDVSAGTSLADQVAAAMIANKPVRLTIATGGPSVNNGGDTTKDTGRKPQWLLDDLIARGASLFTTKVTGGKTSTYPVFWDQYLIERHIKLVQNIAGFLSTFPQLKIVFLGWVNSATNDWNMGSISSNADGLGGSPQSRWLATMSNPLYSMYNDVGAALIASGKALYDAYLAAFPGKIITTSIGRVDDAGYLMNPAGSTNNGRNISEDTLVYANTKAPGRIAAQKNNMNAGGVPWPIPTPPPTSNDWYDLWYFRQTYGLHIGIQMVWAAIGDNACAPDVYGASRMNSASGPCMDSSLALRLSVQKSQAYGGKWAEIYEQDFANLSSTNADPYPGLEIVDVIDFAHRTLSIGPYVPVTRASVPFTANQVTLKFGLTVTPANFGCTFNGVALGLSLPVAASNYPFSFKDVGLTVGTGVASENFPCSFNDVKLGIGLPVATASYGFGVAEDTLATGIVVDTINFPFVAGVIGGGQSIIVETVNFPFAANSVALIYTEIPPTPLPKLPGQTFAPGTKIYVTLQDDMWDLISLRVYGMQRGADHHMDTLLAANPALRDYSRLPGGLYVAIPDIPVQTEVALVPWKKVSVISNP